MRPMINGPGHFELENDLTWARTLARELGVTPQNALRAITPLVNAGIVDEFTGFARNRMWQSREVLHALDDFAARAGRQGA
jgi:DNA-binding transcriptional regulator YhcF (GntR family)